MDAFTVAQAGIEEYFRALTALPAGSCRRQPRHHDHHPAGRHAPRSRLRRLRDSTGTTPAI